MSAGSAVALAGRRLPPARRLALAGAAGELAVDDDRHGAAPGSSSASPIARATAGRAARAARALTAAGGWRWPCAADAAAGTVAGGALMLAGALATRWSVYKAGFQSAADPKYVVEPQRARVAARAESTGALRVVPFAPWALQDAYCYASREE